MIVVDTNVFVALADRRDAHHAECRDWLAGCDEPLIVPPTVLAEACYMIDRYLGAESEAKFLDSVGIGPLCAELTVQRAAWRFRLGRAARQN